MGIGMDTLEDNEERSGQLIDQLKESTGQSEVVSIYYCPVCTCSYSDQEELEIHIFKNHRKFEKFIRVNNKVISKTAFFEAGINTVDVFLNHGSDMDCNWQINGLRKEFTLKSGVPYRIFPNQHLTELTGELIIKLGSGFSQEVYRIVGQTSGLIRYVVLDRLFFEMQDNYNKNPLKFDWSNFRKRITSTILNQYEKEYLDALHDYLLSVHQEIYESSFNSAAFIERAQAKLRPYHSLLAFTIRSVIAFKLNWFNSLENLPQNSFFVKVGSFFTKPFSELINDGNIIKYNKIELTDHGGILIDDYHLEYLKGIIYFFNSDIYNLKLILDRLKKIYIENPTQLTKVKYELLSGRYHRLIGDKLNAIKEYGSLMLEEKYAAEINELRG